MRSHLRAVLVVGLAVGLLAWFLGNADFRAVWAEIRRGRLELLLLAFGTTCATYLLRSLRWQAMLRPIGKTRFVNVFRTTVMGFAASSAGGKIGEVIRPYLLARREGLNATACFATIILERLLDVVTVLVLFAVFLLLTNPAVGAGDPRTFAAIKLGGIIAAAAAVMALVVMYVLAGHPAALGRISLRVERVLPARLAHAFAGLVQTFAEGLAVVRQPRQFFITLLLSFPLWLSIAAGIWWTSLAFHIDMPYEGSFLLMAILVVGVAVPTPGAVGGFHKAFQIGAMAFYSVPKDRAIGAAIVLHAISFVPVTIVGVIFMVQDGLSLARMRSLAKQASEADLDGTDAAEKGLA
jgi:glycosyltransferase 2 family protein